MTQIYWAHSGLYAPVTGLQPTAGLPPDFGFNPFLIPEDAKMCSLTGFSVNLPFLPLFVDVFQNFEALLPLLKNTRFEQI